MMAAPNPDIVKAAFEQCGYEISSEPLSEGADDVFVGELIRDLPQTGVWFVKATAVVWNIAVYVDYLPGTEPRDEVKRFNFLIAIVKESYLASCGRVGLHETHDHRLLLVCETMLVHPEPATTNCTTELRYRLEQLTSLVEAVQRLIDSY